MVRFAAPAHFYDGMVGIFKNIKINSSKATKKKDLPSPHLIKLRVDEFVGQQTTYGVPFQHFPLCNSRPHFLGKGSMQVFNNSRKRNQQI
jgi:hypothetical protein